MRVVRRSTIRDVGGPAGAKPGWRKRGALDTDVATMRNARSDDQAGMAGRADGEDRAAGFIRRDQLAAVRAEAGGCDRQSTLQRRGVLGNWNDAAFAIDREDRAVQIVRSGHQQPVVEPANGVEGDAVEAIDAGDVSKVGRVTLRVDARDAQGFVRS